MHAGGEGIANDIRVCIVRRGDNDRIQRFAFEQVAVVVVERHGAAKLERREPAARGGIRSRDELDLLDKVDAPHMVLPHGTGPDDSIAQLCHGRMLRDSRRALQAGQGPGADSRQQPHGGATLREFQSGRDTPRSQPRGT